MNKSLETVGAIKNLPAYTILSCNTVEELSAKVSEALNGGLMFLHGPPFVFKDQICQALKSSSRD